MKYVNGFTINATGTECFVTYLQTRPQGQSKTTEEVETIIMSEQIKKFLDEIISLKEEIRKREIAIEALQDLCEHEWELLGNTSHDDVYQCIHCKKTENV